MRLSILTATAVALLACTPAKAATIVPHGNDGRWISVEQRVTPAKRHVVRKHHPRRVARAHKPRRHAVARAVVATVTITAAAEQSSLVARARQYLGTNPTGWRARWCGRFMAMIAPKAARRVRNPNLARDWASLPRTSPRVGAIAVLSRKGGGHVGVVVGFQRNGNPILISGNHGRRVGTGTYPRARVIAYVTAALDEGEQHARGWKSPLV